MKKILVVAIAVLGVAGLGAVASAHMWGGGYGGWNGNGPGYGWNCPMGGGWMMGPGWMHGSGYYYNGAEGTAPATLLSQDDIQKRVEAFAAKSFPGYQVGEVERDTNGRPFYGALLTGKNSRFEIQVNGINGRIVSVFPVGE